MCSFVWVSSLLVEQHAAQKRFNELQHRTARLILRVQRLEDAQAHPQTPDERIAEDR